MANGDADCEKDASPDQHFLLFYVAEVSCEDESELVERPAFVEHCLAVKEMNGVAGSD